MINTVKRVRWKNILGLALLIVIVLFIVNLVNWINTALEGGCVSKGSVKVCFSTSTSVEGWRDVTTIKTEVTNIGKTLTDATVSMKVSPNLENLSATSYTTSTQLAPGDTIEWAFKVGPKGEKGRFVVEFDINGDGASDKDIYITAK